MKKTILAIVALIACSFNASAQTEAPEKGFGVEINSTFDLSTGLRFRYLLNKNNAIRLSVGFKSDINKDADDTPVTENGVTTIDDYTEKSKSGKFSIGLGYERHFAVSSKISPYVGAEIGFFKNFRSYSYDSKYSEVGNGDSYYSTAERTYTNIDKDGNIASKGIKFDIVAGVDFYIYKGLYAGAELGLGVKNAKDCKYTKEQKSGNTTTKNEVEPTTSKLSAGFNFEPLLRIGYTF